MVSLVTGCNRMSVKLEELIRHLLLDMIKSRVELLTLVNAGTG